MVVSIRWRSGDLMSADLALPFHGPAPNRQVEVLKQFAWYDAAAWKQELPNAGYWWPPLLDKLTVASRVDGREWRKVTRADVFSLAKTASRPQGMVRLLVASMVWGVGSSAQSRRRHLKVLRPFVDNSSLDSLGKNLLAAVKLAKTTSPIDAYAALHGKKPGEGKLRIEHLGPAYSTKLLYFGSFESCKIALPALILDRRVSTALTWLTATSWAENS